jgi:hypothetical protein
VNVQIGFKDRYRLVGVARFDRFKSGGFDSIHSVHPEQKVIFDNQDDGTLCDSTHSGRPLSHG